MNLRASPTEAPTTIEGAQPTMTELEWNSGIDTYPTSSGPSPIIWAMRFPVTRIRRCEQMTALGAADVPLVKIEGPGVVEVRLGTRVLVRHLRERPLQRVPHDQHVVQPVEPGAISPWWRGSYTTSPQSVCCTSCRRCSPLRVWFTPTTVAPARAAPPKANRYSGTLSSRIPTCRGRPGRRRRSRRLAHRHDSR